MTLDEFDQFEQKVLKIFSHYGYTNQVAQLAEECGELIQAVNKYGRKMKKANKQQLSDLRKKVVEEVADVYLVMHQFKLFFTIYDDEIVEVTNKKVERQIKRIEGEKNESREY